MNSKRIILSCLLIYLCIPTFAYAKIVFRSDRYGNRSLYVMDDNGSNIQRLTVGSKVISWPEWSPDGKQIIFTAQPPGVPNWPQVSAIYIINSDGTGEYRLTNEAARERFPTWSADGKYIAFESNRLSEPGEPITDIWRIDIATKALRKLTHARPDDWISNPSWSPDGKYIAYDDAGIYLMSAVGRNHRKFAQGYRPEWSPDSQSVVYINTIRNGLGEFVRDNIVIHNLKNDERQILDTPDSWSIHSVCFMGPEQVLFAANYWDKENRNEKCDIYRYHLVTGEIINLTNNPKVNDSGMDWISDDVLPVNPKGNKTVTWGTLKR